MDAQLAEITRKRILFLSGLDFKEKSIQVLRKTPEAYAQAGWDVHYIVWRDDSNPDYAYEAEFDPPAVQVERFRKPLSGLCGRVKWRTLRALLSRVGTFLAILELARRGLRQVRGQSFDVIYGHEVFGTLAMALLRWRYRRNLVWLSRFQGVALVNLAFARRSRASAWFSQWQALLAYQIPVHGCIMTNDGTEGDVLLAKLRSPNVQNLRFWTNGIDRFSGPPQDRKELAREFHLPEVSRYLFTSCRLVEGKGLEDCLEVLARLVQHENYRDFHYILAGEGPLRARLQLRLQELQLTGYVTLVGPLYHSDVLRMLTCVDACLLTYEYSNVGNPLLEALAHGRLVFTLATGRTDEWIQHNVNGFIYEVNSQWQKRMAADLADILANKGKEQAIRTYLQSSPDPRLWGWPQRLKAEIGFVESLTGRTRSVSV